MSYYEAERDHKYKVFEKKLQNLMVKPNVLAAMARAGDDEGDLKKVSDIKVCPYENRSKRPSKSTN